MPVPLRMLILEDRAADARLMVEQLRAADFHPDWRCVETEADYVSQLHSGWNVILADYHLPQFNALQALRILQKVNLDIPFLIVTGALSDDAAVECMRQGAADYLIKDRLARLGEAVKQAMEKKAARDHRNEAVAALRRAHAELEERVRQRTVELTTANTNLREEIEKRTTLQQRLSEKIVELEDVLAQVKQLQGLLPICSYCKKIRDDQDYWHQVDHYIRKHSEATFTHGICPDCMVHIVQPELERYRRTLEEGTPDKGDGIQPVDP